MLQYVADRAKSWRIGTSVSCISENPDVKDFIEYPREILVLHIMLLCPNSSPLGISLARIINSDYLAERRIIKTATSVYYSYSLIIIYKKLQELQRK